MVRGRSPTRLRPAPSRTGDCGVGTAPTLDPEAARRLAEAVTILADTAGLANPPADETTASTTSLVRLATADPDVIIYWQME
jgi:ABC-type Fe3+-hydroxamate transport system substrate-binding protein